MCMRSEKTRTRKAAIRQTGVAMMLAGLIVLAVPATVWSNPDSTEASIGFSANPATEGSMVTITGTVLFTDDTHPGNAGNPVLCGKIEIQQLQDDITDEGVPCGSADAAYEPIDSGDPPDAFGEFSTDFDTTDLAGSIIGFRTHYVSAGCGGGHQPGQSSSECADLEIIAQVEEFCGFTQGFWGNYGGQKFGSDTESLIELLLGPIVIGVLTENSVSLDSADCIIERLPAGGKPKALPNNLGDVDDDCGASQGLPLFNDNEHGRSYKNLFMGQVVSLSLNVRIYYLGLDGVVGPGGFDLSAAFCTEGEDGDVEAFTIPQSVIDALSNLGLGNTVNDLLELANRALAGLDTGGASISAINGAVDTINNAFDECRTVVQCGACCLPDECVPGVCGTFEMCENNDTCFCGSTAEGGSFCVQNDACDANPPCSTTSK